MVSLKESGLQLHDGFIIHLKRAKQREPQVSRIIEALPFRTRLVDAVDGRDLSKEQLMRYEVNILSPKYPFSLRPAEIATFLSHRKCWQQIVDEELCAALIVEDDVEIEPSEFGAAISLAMQAATQGDFIRFPVKNREKRGLKLSVDGTTNIFKPWQIGLGMHCQVVTYEAARRLLERTAQFDRPVDTYLQLSWEHGVRVLSLWPSGLLENSANLGGSLIGSPKSRIEKLQREVLRPLYRAKLSMKAICARKNNEKAR